jgi:hypothetical protein
MSDSHFGICRPIIAKIPFAVFILLPAALFANDCLQFKISPDVKVENTAWTREISQPDEPMNALHGSVVASFDEEYNLRVSTRPAAGGYCVILNELEAVVGYTGFLVRIDSSHAPGSCGYNMTLEHEDEHIAAHLAALDGEFENIKKSIQIAADSIMPAFAKSLDGVNAALDKMQEELQSHPDIVLMKQKLNAEQEIRNKKIDEHDDGKRIRECLK